MDRGTQRVYPDLGNPRERGTDRYFTKERMRTPLSRAYLGKHVSETIHLIVIIIIIVIVMVIDIVITILAVYEETFKLSQRDPNWKFFYPLGWDFWGSLA